MNNIESIIIGVISGIITAAILYFLFLVFNGIVLPWYRQFVYNGVDIAGKWEERLVFERGEHGHAQVSTAELSQRADSITGNVTIVKTTNGQITKTEIMSIKGTIRDRLFNAVIIPLDRKRVGTITTLVEVIGDGGKMRGCSSWYDAGSAKIVSECCTWIRK